MINEAQIDADQHRARPLIPVVARIRRHLQKFCATTLLVLSVGGCAILNPHNWRPDPLDHPAHPMTDDQAFGQVIGLAKQIDDAALLDGVDGGVSLASCNDQGDPPYRATLTMGFLIHGDPDAYFEAVARAMATSGWAQGTPPGQHYFGTTLNKDGVVANIGFVPSNHNYGQVHLYGECRDTADHHHDAKDTDITSQLPKH